MAANMIAMTSTKPASKSLGQVNAGLQIVVERASRYEDGPQNQHIVYACIGDAIHQAQPQKEHPFSGSHAVADMVKRVQCCSGNRAWDSAEAGAEPRLDKNLGRRSLRSGLP